MIQIDGDEGSKALRFLRRHAPYSIIDHGVELANSGAVVETSRQGQVVHGVVREGENQEQSVSLDIISFQDVHGTCTCCSPEEMEEQWCTHAVALFWRASELDFFDERQGFAPTESLVRLNLSSPREIATTIEEISKVVVSESRSRLEAPVVKFALDVKGDRLGVQVLFNGSPQGPSFFQGYESRSPRALDDIILRLLDEEGSYDDTHHFWYVNSSNSIEIILGIIREYEEIVSADTLKPIRFSEQTLEATLHLMWDSTGLELSMHWIMPDGSVREKGTELLGTGPHWSCIDSTIYRVATTASRIATLFPYGPRLRVPRLQAGPILEVLQRVPDLGPFIEVSGGEFQPRCDVVRPSVTIELDRRDSRSAHFMAQDVVQIGAIVSFTYPEPPSDQNVVFLPDRNAEDEVLAQLSAQGFANAGTRSDFVITGDDALDLLSKGKNAFPKEWEVKGSENLKKGIKFSRLALNFSLAATQEEGTDDSHPNQFDCQVSLAQNSARVPISILFKRARSDSERWVQLDGGSYAKIPGGNVGKLKMTLGMLDPNFRLSNTIKAKLSTVQAFGLSRFQDDQVTVSLDNYLQTLSKKLDDFKAVKALKPSKSFTGKLRSYQEEGVGWMHFLNEFELGGILADEMGLGKTVQTLALIQRFKEARGKERLKHPVLVVAPTSVLMNWCYEARRFAPNLKTLMLHGPHRRKLFPDIPAHDLILTSYALLRMDRQELERFEFSYCILDEAQNIKNPMAATTRAAKAIRAERRLALTGTPTENRPLELWSIMDFLMPGYLGTPEFFKTYIERPIVEGSLDTQMTSMLIAKTRPFILRRTKAEVERDLPPKVESVVHVTMTLSQTMLYNQILEEVRPKVLEQVEKRGVRGASVSILAALLRLRQVCNHPNSIDALKEIPGYDSGKFNLLRDLIEDAIENKRKILLFSQFREMLAIIRRWVEEKQWSHLYLDGSTMNRQDLIDRFNSDESVRLFLISLKAGGTGLNLTAADTVIIYDPWWNPAVESQAVDRAHRIGQTKPVSVYRLVTEDSVEQKIMDLKERKSKIVDALINDNQASPLALSKADLLNLFSPLPETGEP